MQKNFDSLKDNDIEIIVIAYLYTLSDVLLFPISCWLERRCVGVCALQQLD